MVTCGTYLKLHHFHGTERLRYLCEYLLHLAVNYQWDLQAWAVFPNHYHFVALVYTIATVAKPHQELHSDTALAARQWGEFRATKSGINTGKQTHLQTVILCAVELRAS